MANAYVIGKTIRLSAAITLTATGAATDPTSPTFKLKDPEGTVITYVYPTDAQLVKDTTGNYHVDWATTKVGPHEYRFSGVGTAAGAEESLFQVTQSSII